MSCSEQCSCRHDESSAGLNMYWRQCSVWQSLRVSNKANVSGPAWSRHVDTQPHGASHSSMQVSSSMQMISPPCTGHQVRGAGHSLQAPSSSNPPSQSLSRPSQSSTAPGYTVSSVSSQSAPPHSTAK